MGREPQASPDEEESNNFPACPFSTSLPNQLPLCRLSFETALLVTSYRREDELLFREHTCAQDRNGWEVGAGPGGFYFINHFHWVFKSSSSCLG